MAGDILSSGYKAQTTTVLTTELNSLADGSVCALGSVIANSTTKYLLADVEVNIGSSFAFTASSYVGFFLIPALDDTNYPTWSTGTYQTYHGQYLAGNITMPSHTTTGARETLRGIAVPPGNYKPALLNKVTAALPTSSNIVSIRFYNDAYT